MYELAEHPVEALQLSGRQRCARLAQHGQAPYINMLIQGGLYVSRRNLRLMPELTGVGCSAPQDTESARPTVRYVRAEHPSRRLEDEHEDRGREGDSGQQPAQGMEHDEPR